VTPNPTKLYHNPPISFDILPQSTDFISLHFHYHSSSSKFLNTLHMPLTNIHTALYMGIGKHVLRCKKRGEIFRNNDLYAGNVYYYVLACHLIVFFAEASKWPNSIKVFNPFTNIDTPMIGQVIFLIICLCKLLGVLV